MKRFGNGKCFKKLGVPWGLYTWLDNCACGNAQLNVYVYKPHLMYETLRTTLGHGKEGCILDDWEEIQCHVVV